MTLQLAFGSFGDFVTLIQIIQELATLIHYAVMMRRDMQQFATFLNEYSETISCIKDILQSGPVFVLPPRILQRILKAVGEASRLIRNFITYMQKFRSESWWGEIVIKRMRWALVGKKELTALKEGLLSQRDIIQFALNIANFGTNIRVISIMSTSLPNQPTMHCITFIDFYNRGWQVPLVYCGDRETFHNLLLCNLVRSASFDHVNLELYVLYRQWSGLHDDPWQIPWQAGEVVSMHALCDRYDRKGDEYCIRCGRYNSLNDGRNLEGEGRIECSYCHTVYGAGQGQLRASTQLDLFWIDPSFIEIWMPDIRRITYVPWL